MNEKAQETPAHITPEMAQLIFEVEKSQAIIAQGKRLKRGNVRRRDIRYRLFRIREGGERLHEFDKGLKAFVELQFRSGMNWKNFTFVWDISATEFLKVISPFEWQSSGGKLTKDGYCDPVAFTEQEM